jgi:dGTPase
MEWDLWVQRQSGPEKKRQQDIRDPFERDRARIIHSSSFRRLQAKTQVLGVGESDFYRTRLTHSLEVAQIGSGIVQKLINKDGTSATPWKRYLPTLDLIITICLAHDLGHPPFGHGGEIALNYMMRNHGGFEGNAQTLRILAKLDKYTESFGMDLTRRAMLGVLKYPVIYTEVRSKKHANEQSRYRQCNCHKEIVADEWKPPKCYFDEDKKIVGWILSPFSDEDKECFCQVDESSDSEKHNKSKNKSLDTSIMDLADDIAYGIHDLEDAISLKLVNKDMWNDGVLQELRKIGSEFNGENIEKISDKLFAPHYYDRKEAIGGLVNWLITSAEVEEREEFESPLLRYKVKLPEKDKRALDLIKDFVILEVVNSHPVQILEYKGQQMIMSIFEAIHSDPKRLLPKPTIEKWEAYKKENNCDHGSRVVCDYVSGMTDDYATRIYKMLFVAGDGSIFQNL